MPAPVSPVMTFSPGPKARSNRSIRARSATVSSSSRPGRISNSGTIAGYLSAIRSVVASPSQTVRVRIVDAHEAVLSVDGYDDIPLNVGDVVEVSAREAPIRFVEPRSAMPFWDLLRHKVELLPS